MRAALVLVLSLTLTSAVAAAERNQPPESFAPVADGVKHAVVSVVLPYHDTRADNDNADGLSDADLLRRLFDALSTLPNRTLGAAVMIDPSGVAVTVARILRDRTDVEIATLDGTHYRATVVGRDDRTDVAVLRVAAPVAWPVARFGDSDEVRVGDWVLAVGSPYGFETSVSAGIVSARARFTPGGAYGDFLQTDAAVNSGSAGGPLVDVHGNVVGLVATAAARGAGIAFAVPSNLVGKIARDILAYGSVRRGWLGVAPQRLTRELAEAFALPIAEGLLLTDVVPRGPAAQAGLTRGTALFTLDGRPLREIADLDTALGVAAPGQRVTLELWRAGRTARVSVVLGTEPPVVALVPSVRFRGVTLEGITPDAGVVVADVSRDTAAAIAGLMRGDVIREIDHRITHSVRDFETSAARIDRRARAILLVQREGKTFYVVLAPDAR